ncbi:hypothetical protein Pfo_005383 [Paulownia fortunei]|nr:hypothetical protein Pfo_005383 [Paulownia fortunei]
MRRNCNLNFQILASDAPSSPSSFFSQLVCSDQNQISILYSDATEVQAITILWLARREMEEKYNMSKSKINPGSPSQQLQLHCTRGLSLKKSLQKFLQKRKDRIQASMPY